MGHSVKILADSISPDGARLTSFEATFPRIILAELNTHRVFSRNSASSRAIPVERMLAMVKDDPYVPTHWGKNQKGMAAEQELTESEIAEARQEWLAASVLASQSAQSLLAIGLHKQLTNRWLETAMWHTAVISSTEWSNWDHLRDNPTAHPEIQALAHGMLVARESATPKKLAYGEWHLPYVSDEDREITAKELSPKEQITLLRRVSIGRCAAVSYLRQNVQEMQRDGARCDDLVKNGHMSPLEHAARPMTQDERSLFRQPVRVWDEAINTWVWTGAYTHFLGNFDGWVQHRKTIPNERDALAPKAAT